MLPSQQQYKEYQIQQIAIQHNTVQMDPQTNSQRLKIAQQRQMITPGNNDDDFDYIHSESQSQNLDHSQDTNNKTKEKVQIGEDQQRWEDSPNKQKGESDALQPQTVQQTNTTQQVQHKKQQQDKQNVQQKQQNNKQNPKKNYRKPQHQKKQYKQYITIPYDSRFVYAAYYLLRDELKSIMQDKGTITFNPYICSKNIKICLYSSQKAEQIANKVDQLINEIQVIEMGKSQAESGLQLSYKYQEQLLKQNISFFKDRTQNYKTVSYYICGMVPKRVLYQKITQIKNTTFVWMHMFRFQNSRSYKAILRKIFNTPEIHQYIQQRYKAKQIQVGYLRRGFQAPASMQKRGVLVVLTYLNKQKKLSIHQQMQQSLANFIKQNFVIFCFVFQKNKKQYRQRYTPKVNKVTIFFICQQKNTVMKNSFLYIIMKKKDFAEVRQTVINQVNSMKLFMRGRRFFKNLLPQKQDVKFQQNKYHISHHPRINPYSWSFSPKTGQYFQWEQFFNI